MKTTDSKRKHCKEQIARIAQVSLGLSKKNKGALHVSKILEKHFPNWSKNELKWVISMEKKISTRKRKIETIFGAPIANWIN